MVRQVGGPQAQHAQQHSRSSSNPKPGSSDDKNQPASNPKPGSSEGKNHANQGSASGNRDSDKPLSTPQGALDPKANFEVSQNLKSRQPKPNTDGQKASRESSGGEQLSKPNNQPSPDKETPAPPNPQSPAEPKTNQRADITPPEPQNGNNPKPENAENPAKENTGALNGGGPNELILKNTDSETAKIGLFENFAPGMNPNITGPAATYTLQAGESITLSVPESWQGRAQKLTGAADDPATWAELNYENKDGVHKLWYDNSLIRGYNSAVTIKPTNSDNPDEVAGSGKSLLPGAPQDILTTDSGGTKVIKDVEPYTGGVNTNVENFLDDAEGTSNSYVRFDDHKAVRTSTDNSLTVTFGAA